MNALVVGYGSIGMRHARLLTELGCRTGVVSARQVDFPYIYVDLGDALATGQPEYVVIANSTDKHYNTLSALAELGYAGTVLVEKPIFSCHMDVPPHAFRNAFVAYNLRFHPIIQRLKALLECEKILSVQAYAGQYLPEWRPATDYRSSYSASTKRGGGVLRDLSHELDYLTWMLGGWERVSALGGHLSSLEINSDDVFALMLVTPRCPIVTLQLNYLDRFARRFIIVNTFNHTIEADLRSGTITIDRHVESFSCERDYTYRAMHSAIMSDCASAVCSLAGGLETLRLIEAAEQAVAQKMWVGR